MFAHQLCVQTQALNDPSPLYEKMFDSINKISHQIEMFNVHYITKLDEKFVAIIKMMSTMDANIKQLQERSQSWDIFAHHMNVWNENIKITDQKIEILKKSVDTLPIIENQLQNSDFKIQHIFERTDLINEKLNEVTKSILYIGSKNSVKQKMVSRDNKAQKQTFSQQRNWSQEDFEQTEILLRLSKIQRLLQNTCSTIRLDKEFENASGRNGMDVNSDLKALISQINGNLEKFPLKEIKQSLNLHKKHDKVLETLTATVNHIDERTIRIFDTNSYQYKKIITNYKGTENEMLTFTNNANILLKKVEMVVRAVSFNHQMPGINDEKCNNSTIADTQINEVEDSDEVEDEIMDQKGTILLNVACFSLRILSFFFIPFGNFLV
jgi:hypothetical protein